MTAEDGMRTDKHSHYHEKKPAMQRVFFCFKISSVDRLLTVRCTSTTVHMDVWRKAAAETGPYGPITPSV
jgi:hypothetical protein